MPKTVLITGASRGIGRACALLAAENGWSVGVNYREDAKAADAVVETIAKQGGRAVALKGDVSVEADAVGMFDAATKALGPLTAVIANAGVVAPTAKLTDMTAERMRHILEVNVLGAFLTAREAARRLAKSSGGAGGSIVLMSSAAARLGSPNLYIDYAASKGAIDTLTLGLAKELAPEEVRVNAAGPPGHGQGSRRGGDMAHQRRGLLRDGRAARCLGRTLTGGFARIWPPKAALTHFGP